MMNTGFGIAGMISPVVFGMIIQRTGRYDLPFLISAGLLLLGAGLATLIDPTRTIEDAESTMTSGRQAAAL
jgi:ACS family D-galactonate transporter-like MFS transporter